MHVVTQKLVVCIQILTGVMQLLAKMSNCWLFFDSLEACAVRQAQLDSLTFSLGQVFFQLFFTQSSQDLLERHVWHLKEKPERIYA